MASYYYGINQGANEYSAAVGTSTNSTEVELVVVDTVTSKQAVITALEKLLNFVIRSNYPPA
jgi:hypothetical protein